MSGIAAQNNEEQEQLEGERVAAEAETEQGNIKYERFWPEAKETQHGNNINIECFHCSEKKTVDISEIKIQSLTGRIFCSDKCSSEDRTSEGL